MTIVFEYLTVNSHQIVLVLLMCLFYIEDMLTRKLHEIKIKHFNGWEILLKGAM